MTIKYLRFLQSQRIQNSFTLRNSISQALRLRIITSNSLLYIRQLHSTRSIFFEQNVYGLKNPLLSLQSNILLTHYPEVSVLTTVSYLQSNCIRRGTDINICLSFLKALSVSAVYQKAWSFYTRTVRRAVSLENPLINVQ